MLSYTELHMKSNKIKSLSFGPNILRAYVIIWIILGTTVSVISKDLNINKLIPFLHILMHIILSVNKLHYTKYGMGDTDVKHAQ